MRQVPVAVPAGASDALVRSAIEGACAAAGLRLKLKGTLRTFPGSTHWHFARGDSAGTLEATYWPRGRQAWFSVQSRRSSAWIDAVLPVVLESIRLRLAAAQAGE